MLKRIVSSLLILIVLIGTVGFSYDAHFCGGDLVDDQFAFLTEDLSCGMPTDAMLSDHDVNIYELCCSSEHETFQIDDDFVDYKSSQLIINTDFSFPQIEIEFISIVKESKYEFFGYSPPPFDTDRVVLNQSFLI